MINELQFWLTYNNGAEMLRLPVNPESVRIAKTHGYDDVMTTQLGELTVIGSDRLREYSFSSFFPRDYNSSYCEYSDIPSPQDAVNLIESWIETRRPIRLTITGSVNIPVTVRSFTYEARAGHVGDIFYSISLKAYRFTELKSVTEKAADGVLMASAYVSGQETRVGVAVPLVSSYTVKEGDNLTKIAHIVYVDGDRWPEIYDANKVTIGRNPNLIYAGQVLSIP
ncbi:LysM peptidoglycan-binding domain-containing protein [Paenibacillus sp. HWE-109]|uniref:LysM peptidoglycan-binding domain-containing protein n=1 Tax=Paenibacillus sp. HWE-109 TaxID=1306526 RepID=UPI001EE1474A|nr:LysM peptidoglycan-binding domain-containing protein [Paenibacillus sp. HWE-109]UKS30150.1 LysM peptidoglycan-binding domain-containing protein [Paenibacillus sp. HWE-109]